MVIETEIMTVPPPTSAYSKQ